MLDMSKYRRKRSRKGLKYRGVSKYILIDRWNKVVEEGYSVDYHNEGILNIEGPSNSFKSEREAALHLDKILIGRGLEPINILKRLENVKRNTTTGIQESKNTSRTQT